MNWIFIITAINLLLLPPHINSQQNYTGNDVLYCDKTDESFHYTCNGEYPSCRAFLLFKAKPPYNTVPAIGALITSSHLPEILRLNNGIKKFTLLQTGHEIIIPVNCSCSENHYQATTTYQVQTQSETLFSIANDTYEGLSTCASLRRANGQYYTPPGSLPELLRVPLRCACPTRGQALEGTRFLMTYSIKWGDTIYALSKRLGVSKERIIEANGIPDDEVSKIYPFTTILIPLSREPSGSRVMSRGFNNNNRTQLSPPVNVVIIKSSGFKFLSPAVISAIALSLLILIFLVVLVFICCKRRTRKGKAASSPRDHLMLEIARFDRALKVFEYSDIKKATKNFGSKNRIGGCVYRGNFRRQVMAVKKKSIGKTDNEVKMLQQINHFNIVKLQGFCQHRDELYLVYDYLNNGTLREWLMSVKEPSKSFNQRIRVALDVANGLLYLHNFTNPAYVHNNLNTSNILLDGDFRAKIANFSLARRANCDSITGVIRERVCVAPECVEAARVSPKVDVFAFGVVLLEILTGKCPILAEGGGGERLVWRTTAEVMEGQNEETEVREFVDQSVGENGEMMEYLTPLVGLGLSCSGKDPAGRPDMVEVVKILQKVQVNVQRLVNGVGEKKMDLSLEVSSDASFSFSSSSVV